MTNASMPPVNAPALPRANDLNSVLMEMTFPIIGPHAKLPGQQSIGTGFVIGKRAPGEMNQSYYVLVTAAHVFDDIAGDEFTTYVRSLKPDGSYDVSPWILQFRQNGTNLYVKHGTVDIAAIYFRLPDQYRQTPVVSETLLITEADIIKYELHPGYELNCLGYPLGASGPNWFPILRSGKIASYPLTPLQHYQGWMFDFQVYGGNSGGPVYMVEKDPTYGGSVYLGTRLSYIVGLVTQQVSALSTGTLTTLSLGVLVPAPFIAETLALLPPSP